MQSCLCTRGDNRACLLLLLAGAVEGGVGGGGDDFLCFKMHYEPFQQEVIG